VNNGPVISSMIVFEDLIKYKKGTYSYRNGDVIGAHAILITGFGDDKDGN
jgi:C1A family cysteine protease